MVMAPEHAAERHTACEGVKHVYARQNVRRRVYAVKILDHPHEDAVRLDLGAERKTVREDKTYDDKKRHADNEVPRHREELPLVPEEHVHDRGDHEREPQKIRNDELRNERDHVIKRNVDYGNVSHVPLREEEEYKVDRKVKNKLPVLKFLFHA